jgi:hypothetical protein
MVMIVAQLVAGETAVIAGNLPEYRSVYHSSHMTWPGFEPWQQRWEAGNWPPEQRHGLLLTDSICMILLDRTTADGLLNEFPSFQESWKLVVLKKPSNSFSAIYIVHPSCFKIHLITFSPSTPWSSKWTIALLGLFRSRICIRNMCNNM